MPFELTIHERDGAPRTQVLPGRVVFFGRREDNDVVLPFTFVSSRHGRVFLRDGAVLVEDMGSTNGTLVNGEPLTPMIARPLGPEDRVQIEKIAIQACWVKDATSGAAESVTYHELSRPTLSSANAESVPTVTAAALPVPTSPEADLAPRPLPSAPEEPTLPVPLASGVDGPLVRAASASPRPDLEKAAQLGQPSLSHALATNRPPPQKEEEARDPYRAWEVLFKTVGLIAVLGGLALIIFVLVA